MKKRNITKQQTRLLYDKLYKAETNKEKKKLLRLIRIDTQLKMF